MNPIQAVLARTAGSVGDMVGVNVHLSYGTTQYANYPQLNSELAKLGVSEVRDSLSYNPKFVSTTQYNEYNALKAQGIGVDLVLSQSTNQSDLAARVAAAAKYFPTAVTSIEPPNEWNLSGDPNWAPDIISYQKAMYAAIKATPALSKTAVYGPVMGGRSGYTQLGDLSSYMDAGNIHLYYGGLVPSSRIDSQLSAEATVSGSHPISVTEMGYHDDTNPTLTELGTPDSVTASYLPQVFLEYAMRGVQHVWNYELYDEACDPNMTNKQDHYGLIDCNGHEKPQFTALANFDNILADTTNSFTPGTLSYSVNAPGQGIEQLLVQKSNGVYELFLWRDAQEWNATTATSVAVTPTPVTVQFATPIVSASVIDPTVSLTPQQTIGATSTIQVPLSGDAVAVQITAS